jgi:CheY-like chemotaxis protein
MEITVLIVDDSKLARIVVGKKLAALQPGWKRIEAGNADEAMTVLSERQVDVALLDFNMPGKSGLDLAADLRALHPTMPIALITANVQDEIVSRARAVGAAFVAKPVTEDGLRDFISGVAARFLADSR